MARFARLVSVLILVGACTTHHNDVPHTDAPEPNQRTDAAVQAALASITGSEIRAHMEVLAADELGGREAGTEYYDASTNYLVGEYEAHGLKPMGGNGRYLQPIEFFETRLVPESAKLSLSKGEQNVELTFRDDFVRSGGYSDTHESVSAPLVFAGYGIVAPEFEHDDFSGIDVTGKILVLLSGAPPRFDTDRRAYYSSGRGKATLAEELGAVGILSMRTPVDQKRRPWARYLPGVGTPGMRWLRPDGTPHQGFTKLQGSAILSETGAQKLFALSGHDLEALFVKHEAGGTGSFDLGVTAAASRTSKQRRVTSSNVVGLLEGSDPELKDEYIIYTGHLDHIGIRPGKNGDDIHNGAYDNAAGIGTILEVLDAMANMRLAPRRSILFAAVTAEEKGLQGSSYFAKNPTVPIDQLVANINIDMPYFGFPLADVNAFGAEHSTLLGAATDAAQQVGLRLTPDPQPEEVRFIRSDQFSFVKEGVPALAFKAGSASSDPSIDGPAQLDDFLKNHYHQASDDLDLPYSAEAAERFARASFLLGLMVAEADERPRWVENDFFGDKFGR